LFNHEAMLDYKHYSISTSAFLSLKIFFIYKKKLSLLNLESLVVYDLNRHKKLLYCLYVQEGIV